MVGWGLASHVSRELLGIKLSSKPVIPKPVVVKRIRWSGKFSRLEYLPVTQGVAGSESRPFHLPPKVRGVVQLVSTGLQRRVLGVRVSPPLQKSS